jgi:LysM repeat protein
MAVTNPGRLLAPVALVAAIVAVVLVTTSALGHHHAVRARTDRHAPVVHRTVSQKSYYVIRIGDSLSSISVKTGVPISKLEALNPSIDPGALQAGQRLRLSP